MNPETQSSNLHSNYSLLILPRVNELRRVGSQLGRLIGLQIFEFNKMVEILGRAVLLVNERPF